MIGERLPNSAAIGVPALVLSTILGMAMGVAAAVKRDTWVDKSMRVVAVLGQSMPGFLGVDYGDLHLFRSAAGAAHLGYGLARSLHLPIAVLTFFALPMRMRLMRSSLLEILGMEYIKQARAKGLSERAVIMRHAVRNSLSPQLTSFGLTLAFAITGAVLVETVFSWPGLGQLAYQAMLSRDYPLIQGTVLLVALLVIVANLMVDVLYAYVDPRIRY